MDEESNSDGAANADDDGAPIEPSQYDPEITTNHIVSRLNEGYILSIF